jgi:hypothetical protein
MGAPIEDALAYEGSGITVLLPTRYVAFDTRRSVVSTFAPDEMEKRDEFTFQEGRLGDVAYNPNLHGGRPLLNTLLNGTDFQITYSFPREFRQGVTAVAGKFSGVRVWYGSERFTFRQLYDFLCSRFNGGERFVDVYFQTIFPYSAVGRRFKRFEATVYEELNAEHDRRRAAAWERRHTRRGAPDMRTSEGLRLNDFDAWKSGRVAEALSELERFRRDIRDDIIQCLSTGKLPLNHVNAYETMELRGYLGLDDEHVFYASGRLIESIEVDVRMPEDAFVV